MPGQKKKWDELSPSGKYKRVRREGGSLDDLSPEDRAALAAYSTQAQAKFRKSDRWQDRTRTIQARIDAATRPCVHCGAYHKGFMTFHHRDPATKKFGLGGVATTGRSWAAIKAEIAKCECMCANCHYMLHWCEPKGLDFAEVLLQYQSSLNHKRRNP